MGMRFKKSKKIAPGVKLNVSNKSVGVSVGGKGVHHSVSSSGRKTTTVSAPGTGLSYVKTSGGGSRKRKSSKKAQSGTVGCGTILLGFILFFLIVGVFSSGFSSGRKKAAEAAASSSSAASSSTVSAVSETSTPTPTEAPRGNESNVLPVIAQHSSRCKRGCRKARHVLGWRLCYRYQF